MITQSKSNQRGRNQFEIEGNIASEFEEHIGYRKPKKKEEIERGPQMVVQLPNTIIRETTV